MNDTIRLIVTILTAISGAVAVVYAGEKWAAVVAAVGSTLATTYGIATHKKIQAAKAAAEEETKE